MKNNDNEEHSDDNDKKDKKLDKHNVVDDEDYDDDDDNYAAKKDDSRNYLELEEQEFSRIRSSHKPLKTRRMEIEANDHANNDYNKNNDGND